MPTTHKRLITGGRCACGALLAPNSKRRCENCRTFVSRIRTMARLGYLPKVGGKPYRIKARSDGMCCDCGSGPRFTRANGHRRARCLNCHRAAEVERSRVKDGRRRTAKRMTNLTRADIRLQMKRTYCQLCRRRMTNERDLPLSKHHDHIIPINVGGTHTWENTRVICRDCNLKRPKDGSDVTGQVALWSAEPAFAPMQRSPRVVAHKPPPQRMHCMPPSPCACGCGAPVRYRKLYVKGHHGRGRFRGSKHEHLYPQVDAMLQRGDRSKRIARALGISRDTAREIMARMEKVGATQREMWHA